MDVPSLDTAKIKAVVQKYFDALYNGNADLFAEIFHPTATLYCFTEASPTVINIQEYLEIVRTRASPASKNDPRKDEIVSIEIPTPSTAHMRVREIFIGKHFTDELTLVKTIDEWKIVSKVWHFTSIDI